MREVCWILGSVCKRKGHETEKGSGENWRDTWGRCVGCDKERGSKRYKENPEKCREINIRYRKKNSKKMQERTKQRYELVKNFLYNYYVQIGGCADCAENCFLKYDPEVMEGHHFDPTTKERGLSKVYSIYTLIKELQKCILLCVYHHVKRHIGIKNGATPRGGNK